MANELRKRILQMAGMKITFGKLVGWVGGKILGAMYCLAYFCAKTDAANKKNKVLILPPADGWDGRGEYSFGDEMLMLGLLAGLEGKFGDDIHVISMYGNLRDEAVMHGRRVKLFAFKKNWLSLNSYREFACAISGFSHFIVMGADVLDGGYGKINSVQRIRFLKIAAKKGLKTGVTGCSFSEKRDAEIMSLLQGAEQLGSVIYARERISLNRLKTFLKGPKLSADLAFMVDPEGYTSPPRIRRLIDQVIAGRQHYKVVIGVNLCGWNIKDRAAFLKSLSLSLRSINIKLGGVALILIPHDTREDVCSDLTVLNELMRQMEGDIKVFGRPSDIRSGIDAKKVVALCDVLLTGRLHLAIAAHDQGVPAISFAYQGKFEGFYDLYGMKSEYIASYDCPAKAVKDLLSAVENKDCLSSGIRGRGTGIRQYARLNVEWI